MSILYAVLVISLLGLALGYGLSVASKRLHVKKDPKLTALTETLPGINCGACGFAGCSAYAEALINDSAEPTLCSPGGPETVERIGSLLGVVTQMGEKMVAMVHCCGTSSVAKRSHTYRGIPDCNAAHLLYSGDKQCKYGCLGLGSCVKVCPVEAISYLDNGLVSVDTKICISCKKCVVQCPTGVMKMVPESFDFLVACNSIDKGAVVKKYCTAGCIGCSLCVRKAPEGGYKVENFLASIDYTAEGDREAGAVACPSKCIRKCV